MASPPPLPSSRIWFTCGFLVSEGQPGAPGDIRAFDVRTGKEAWRFHTAPRPGEVGQRDMGGRTAGRSAPASMPGRASRSTRNTASCSAAPGSASSDFYGADRKGANLFANCTLALDARTGKRLWHFQEVHHDLWDHDNPCPPIVVTVLHNGKRVEAVAQLTKTGFCYLFDRADRQSRFSTSSRSLPRSSDVPGEQAYATQPHPVKPPAFSPQAVHGRRDHRHLAGIARLCSRKSCEKLHYGQAHLPPSVAGTVVSARFSRRRDLERRLVRSHHGPAVRQLQQRALHLRASRRTRLAATISAATPTSTTQFGYPANKPPWGSLTAIDLNTGRIRVADTARRVPGTDRKGRSARPARKTSAARLSRQAGWSSSARRRTRSFTPSTRRRADCCGSTNCRTAGTPRPAPTW